MRTQFVPTEVITGDAVPFASSLEESLHFVKCGPSNPLQYLEDELDLLATGDYVISVNYFVDAGNLALTVPNDIDIISLVHLAPLAREVAVEFCNSANYVNLFLIAEYE